MSRLDVFVLPGLPDFHPGDDLSAAIQTAAIDAEMPLQDGDILVIAHKVVSKSEGAVHDINEITASDEAIKLAEQVNKDPRKVELILQQSKRIVRARKNPQQETGVIIAEHKLGFICANAAIDESNSENDQLITLPENPDDSARRLCESLEAKFDCRLGIVISDTFGRPWRLGQTNVAIGIANVPAINYLEGETDAWGKEMKVTAPALADELAAASGLLMIKDGKCPVIVFRGIDWQIDSQAKASDLLRSSEENLFK